MVRKAWHAVLPGFVVLALLSGTGCSDPAPACVDASCGVSDVSGEIEPELPATCACLSVQQTSALDTCPVEQELVIGCALTGTEVSVYLANCGQEDLMVTTLILSAASLEFKIVTPPAVPFVIPGGEPGAGPTVLTIRYVPEDTACDDVSELWVSAATPSGPLPILVMPIRVEP